MKTVYHEAMHPLGNLGLKISMAALESPHIPMHWHDAMEILFCLNGEVTIQIDHEAFCFPATSWSFLTLRRCIPSSLPLLFICFYAFMWTKADGIVLPGSGIVPHPMSATAAGSPQVNRIPYALSACP